MPLRELGHRAFYLGFTAVERRQHQRGCLTRPDRLRSALVSRLARDPEWEQALLRRRSQSRFFAWQDDPVELRDALRSGYGSELAKARAIAGQTARHEIAFFGETFHFGPEIDWHVDPVTGAQWPQSYHRDIDTRISAGCGDVKHVWELNRHQFLMDLAKIALVDGTDAFANEVVDLLRSWQRAAPYGTGTPWACALEPGFRAWSWLWAYHMLLSADKLTVAAHLDWLAGFEDHGRFLHRHLEHYTSPYNHLIGEASALFALGLAFPEFRESAAWVRRGKQVLERTVDAQFHPDGGTVEQSTFYHHATLGFYLLAAVIGQRHGTPLNARCWSAIEKGIEFSIALVLPDGKLPAIGGADDGKPIRLEHLPFWDFRPYYAIGAVLYQRTDFKAAASRFWEDAIWVLGPRARRAFESLPEASPPISVTLEHSGYAIFRSNRSATGDYLLVDCGPQAGGLRRDDVPSAAHGHADCLSIVASLAGHRVLVDPGFYCYNADPEWEIHFRKTPAHNTVTVDGRDQAQHVSKMDWAHTYQARLEDVSPGCAIGWVCGSHDGYARQINGVIHRRAAWLREGGYIIVLDELCGDAGAMARANFQFAPGCLLLAGPEYALFDDRFELAWSCSTPVEANTVAEGDGPDGGWIAPSLGVRQRAPRLELAFRVRPPRVLLLTVLADRQRTSVEKNRLGDPVRNNEMGRVDFMLTGAGWTDWIVASPDGQTEGSGIRTDALLTVVRVRSAGVESALRIGGTYLEVNDGEVVSFLEGSANSTSRV